MSGIRRPPRDPEDLSVNAATGARPSAAILPTMGEAGRLVAILGEGVVDADTRFVTGWDDGLLRGDGCFDALRLVMTPQGARVDHRDEHMARFERSAAAAGLDLDRAAWDELIDEAVSSWTAPGEAMIRVVTTRGAASARTGTSFLTISPLPASVTRDRQGLSVVTANRGYASDAFTNAPWLLGGVKMLSYAINMAASRYAHSVGAGDALFVSGDGFALEAPTAALLWWADGSLWTTRTGATGVLRSVTAEALLAEAKEHGIATGFALVRPGELTQAWLCSAARGVCPITTLDGRALDVDADRTATFAGWVGF